MPRSVQYDHRNRALYNMGIGCTAAIFRAREPPRARRTVISSSGLKVTAPVHTELQHKLWRSAGHIRPIGEQRGMLFFQNRARTSRQQC